jgi:hypothetical protein
LSFRVERLIEWNNFDRVIRPTRDVTTRFKRELERHSPNGKPMEPTGWSILTLVWGNWLDMDDGGCKDLVFFAGHLEKVHLPLDGKPAFDFNAAVQELMLASNDIVIALRDFSLGPLHTHTKTFDGRLGVINNHRRVSHDSELNQLLTAVGRMRPQIAA